jgi:hypothetical protein
MSWPCRLLGQVCLVSKLEEMEKDLLSIRDGLLFFVGLVEPEFVTAIRALETAVVIVRRSEEPWNNGRVKSLEYLKTIFPILRNLGKRDWKEQRAPHTTP